MIEGNGFPHHSTLLEMEWRKIAVRRVRKNGPNMVFIPFERPRDHTHFLFNYRNTTQTVMNARQQS